MRKGLITMKGIIKKTAKELKSRLYEEGYDFKTKIGDNSITLIDIYGEFCVISFTLMKDNKIYFEIDYPEDLPLECQEDIIFETVYECIDSTGRLYDLPSEDVI